MKNILFIAAILGALAVGIGAFGAHALKSLVIAERLPIFETGVRYHFYHVFALFITYLLAQRTENQQNLPKNLPKNLLWAARFFIIGILFFSGSLYLLACRDVLPFSVAFAGPITPIGGVFFIMGWLAIAFEVRK
jgi:uncharacterized membrane protein YgdD (TMEM256/DUF423 family)